ncbi:MAG: HAMP domain-containing histidine kinase [Clostridiales bacterium]|jgi:signal transduction histidine kinase|nr:HAMP domain-containing histidine kinase [Clostridiales bacterium]
MKFRGITRRWLGKTLGFAAPLMLVLAVSLSAWIHMFYYNSVKNLLDSRDNNVVTTFFNIYSGAADESFSEAARDFIENFGDGDKMCVWVINKHGRIIAASDGFQPPENVPMPDYEEALVSMTGRGDWRGRLDTGEKIAAMTLMLSPPGSGSAAAVRYMISLEAIDSQIAGLISMVAAASFLAILIFIFPSTIFIAKVVKEIKNVTKAAKRVAAGDLDTRIEFYSRNDEIGELQKTVNNMVAEISDADRVKNEFISTISHELRTPLTAIKGWGETLQQIGESDAAMTKRGMEVIISESTRLTGMVEELLDFSRMQSGGMRLRKEKMDVLAELDETVFTFKERALRDGKELLYNAVNEPAPIEGDSDRIKQVFVNVIDNAIKYTKQGGKILVEAELKDGGTLEITVSDTGCGIAEKDLPRVTEKFFKADTSVRGSGIGLAVADEIVKMHSGELAINSILDTGTTVTIKLPVGTVLPAAERNGQQNEQGDKE